MMPEHINELSILVSAILAVAIGTIWYSPLLFGERETSLPHDIGTSNLASRFGALKTTLVDLLIQGVFFMVLAQIIVLFDDEDLSFLKLCGFLTALIATQTTTLAVHEKRDYVYVLGHVGYSLIVVFTGIGVMVFWPW